jgi:preprotein translocase subunit SecE
VRQPSEAVQRVVWSAFFIVLGMSLGFGLFLALR